MPDPNKPKLFLSHATEDKAAFVEPLEKELQLRGYPTWYDVNNLAPKESLLSEVNTGLLQSDFGITIFSKHYFGKKWTLGELDGLYALETATKKIIVPIRYNLTFEELKQLQPILAGRMIIDGNLGIKQVADEIELAVEYVARGKSLSPLEAMKAKLKRVEDVRAADQANARYMGCVEGVDIIINALKRVADSIESAVKEFAEAQPGWKATQVTIARNYQPRVSVDCPFHLWGQLSMVGMAMNGTHNAKLCLDVRKGVFDSWGQEISHQKLTSEEFTPYIYSPDSVKWFNSKVTIQNEDLAAHFLAALVDRVDKEGSQGKRPI